MSNEVIIAVIGLFGGGFGLRLIEYMMRKSDTRMDESTAYKKEIREDLKYFREREREQNIEVDKWRKEYFLLREQYASLHEKLKSAESEVGLLRTIIGDQ